MNKRILFVVPIRQRYNVPAIDLGLRYLATAARRAGWHAEILHCGKERYNYRKFASFLKSNSYDVIGFKCLSYDFPSVRYHAQIVRQIQPRATIVMGGPHPSALPLDSLAESPEIDYAWQGEAEIGLPLFLERLEDIQSGRGQVCADIPGLVWRDKGEIKCNPPSYAANLDDLGMPAWDIIDPLSYPDTTIGSYIPIITTRGCPFSCSFCSAYNVVGHRLRFRSVDAILEELKYLNKQYRITKFSIADDNFTFNTEFASAVCERIKMEGLKIKWDCSNGIRLDTITTDLISTMEEAGCYSVAVGVESGSQRILNLMRKRISLETIKDRVALIKAHSKIKITGFHMIGYPTETVPEVKQTIRLACELPLDQANFSLVIPLPGTELWNNLIAQGLLDPAHIDWNNFYADRISFPRPDIDDGTLLHLQRQAYLAFYLRPRVIKGILEEIFTSRNLHRILTRKAISVILRK